MWWPQPCPHAGCPAPTGRAHVSLTRWRPAPAAYEDPASNSVIFDTIQLFPSFLPCSLAFSGVTLNATINDWQKQQKGRATAQPLRLNLPLDNPGKRVTPQKIGRTGVEFPTIRADRSGKPYRYVYANLAANMNAGYYDALTKMDLVTGRSLTWSVPGHYPGEPLFAADPDGLAEDDGVVMSTVLDTNNSQTYVLLLNASSFLPIAHVGPTPHVIPHGYHGRYFS